jgi:hypothetical protein
LRQKPKKMLTQSRKRREKNGENNKRKDRNQVTYSSSKNKDT